MVIFPLVPSKNRAENAAKGTIGSWKMRVTKSAYQFKNKLKSDEPTGERG